MFKYPELISEREAIKLPLPDVKWHVTEKLHGANLHVRINKYETIRMFRRNGELQHGECFHNWEELKERMTERLLNVYYHVGAAEISIFGELIGGNGVNKPVQKQIIYCPTYEYVVFDIYDHGKQAFLSLDQVVEICKECDVYVVDILHRDMTLEEIYAIDHNEDETAAPRTILGYTGPLPIHNYIEGWVIRPNQELPSGRWLIKRRTNRFLDRICDVRSSEPKPGHTFFHQACECITVARLDAIVSKELEDVSIGTLSLLMYDDIVNELKPETEIPLPVQKKIRGKIGAFISQIKNG